MEAGMLDERWTASPSGADPPADFAACLPFEQPCGAVKQEDLSAFLSTLERHEPLPSSLELLGTSAPAQTLGSHHYPLPTLPVIQAASSAAADSFAATSGQPEASDTATLAGSASRPKQRRGPRPRLFKKGTCQSDGCPEDLGRDLPMPPISTRSTLSFYYQRNHICPAHLKSESYVCRGVDTRFCQRCGVGHPLTDFEGSKRSCRKSLEKHNNRRRERQARVSSAPPPLAAAAAAAAAGEVEQPLLLAALPPGALSMPLELPSMDVVDPALQHGLGLPPRPAAVAGGAPAPLQHVTEAEDSGGQLTQVLSASAGASPAAAHGGAGEAGATVGSFAAIMQAPVVPQGLAPLLPLEQAAPAPAPQLLQHVQLTPVPPPQAPEPQQWVLVPKHVLDQLLPMLSAVGSGTLASLGQAAGAMQQPAVAFAPAGLLRPPPAPH
eukprot:scaffold2.g7291.t1